MEGNLLQLLLLRSDDCPELGLVSIPDILNEQIALMGLLGRRFEKYSKCGMVLTIG